MADLINFFFPNFTFVYELTMDVIDVFYKFSKIIIALINVYLLYYIFNYNTKANASQNEKDRKTRLFTKIIIEHNFERVSSFYSGLFTIFNVFGEENYLTTKVRTKSILITIFQTYFLVLLVFLLNKRVSCLEL